MKTADKREKLQYIGVKHREQQTKNHHAENCSVEKKNLRKRKDLLFVVWTLVFFGICFLAILIITKVVISSPVGYHYEVQAADGLKGQTEAANQTGSSNQTEAANQTGNSNQTNAATQEHSEESDASVKQGQELIKKLAISKEDLTVVQAYAAANPDIVVLVNKDKEFDLTRQLQLRSICSGRLQAADVVYDSLSEMLQAASDVGHEYWIASAYRSRERQQELIDEDVAENEQKGMSAQEALLESQKETMPAGYSEHETGLAFDILSSVDRKMDVSQKDTADNQWMQEHCAAYGFVLRYPKEKESITHISYEPWHFRYVGRPVAAFMEKYNLSLEEFHDCLAAAQE